MKKILLLIFAAFAFGCAVHKNTETITEKVTRDSTAVSLDTLAIPVFLPADTVTVSGKIQVYRDSLDRLKLVPFAAEVKGDRGILRVNVMEDGEIFATAICNEYRDTLQVIRANVTRFVDNYSRESYTNTELKKAGTFYTDSGFWLLVAAAVLIFAFFIRKYILRK